MLSFPALTSINLCGCSDAVKYFNNEALERSNFAEAVNIYQRTEYKVCLCFISSLRLQRNLLMTEKYSHGNPRCLYMFQPCIS